MASHPDLLAEQAYLDHAYRCLESSRDSAKRLRGMVEVGKGGTEQARWEREMIEGNIASRLNDLHLGDNSLIFGRIDLRQDEGGDSFYIGRLAVADDEMEPVVVDWRAPVAEPFYRATGRQHMGLVRRRHFASRGRDLIDIEDELFGAGSEVGGQYGVIDSDTTVTGQGTLIRSLETARTGQLGDIVATIQGEQDEIIRAPLPGVLVVQGGPGTGKTVVALHRAAYLLYTHRFPLEGQGVLVVGPNRLFLGYIEQVLPSLGEAGVELAVFDDLVDDVTISGRDEPEASRIKGDLRMVQVLARAVRDRKRALRHDLRIGYGLQHLTLTVEASERVVAEARRRSRGHNAGRRHVEDAFFHELALSGRDDLVASEVRARTRRLPEIVAALEWMWPVLTPAQLLNDLFGSRALLASASGRRLDGDEQRALFRPRVSHDEEPVFTSDDSPLLDEARTILGPTPRRRRLHGTDEVRTYGHIVVDEAQDLSPMQLRMLNRRSLNGSMTVVGDIAQSTGAWAHQDWDEILQHLPSRREPRRAGLTIGYRIPAPNMELAARVLRIAAPDLQPPRPVRQTGDPPQIVSTTNLIDTVVDLALSEREEVGAGSVAVIVAGAMVADVEQGFAARGVEVGHASRRGLAAPVTLVPVGLVKGLELDASVVVEPAAILEGEVQGARALYVALTRATKRLAIVHERPLPAVLLDPS